MVFSKVTKRENLGLGIPDPQDTEATKLGETKVLRVHRQYTGEEITINSENINILNEVSLLALSVSPCEVTRERGNSQIDWRM